MGARSVPDGGHETTTTPDLLTAPDLTGAVATIDAAFRQKAIVAQTREQGEDYVVCVKGNQKGLRAAVAGTFERAGEAAFVGCDVAQEVGAARGRHEERYVSVMLFVWIRRRTTSVMPAARPDRSQAVNTGSDCLTA